MAHIIDKSFDDVKHIDVEKDSYATSNNFPLVADCLGTCLGVAAYDSKTDTGFLLHESTVENEELEDDLDSFLEKLDYLEQPYEVLAAGTISPDYNPLTEQNYIGKARAVVEKSLEERGVRYETAWNESPVFNRLIVSPQHGILYDKPEL